MMASYTYYLDYPDNLNKRYVCGLPMTIRWSIMLFSGSLSEINERIWFRIYNLDHPEYTPLAMGPVYLTAKSYTHLLGITVGSGWRGFRYYSGVNDPTEADWTEFGSDVLELELVAPDKPNNPVITAPSPGAEFYTNAQLPVAWTYSDPSGLPQYKREIALVSDEDVVTTLVSGVSVNKAETIPAGAVTLPAGVQKKYYTLYVSVANQYAVPYAKSNGVLIGILSTVPDKPVPTQPAAGAVSYPLAALEVAFAYTARGGYALAKVIFEYYKAGETAWNRSLTIDASEPSIEIPANTFATGVWYWRIRARNANGETGEPSDARMLTVIASTPLAPILTAPAAGSTQYNHQPVAYEWTYLNNADVDQGAAQLQYRVGDADWTTEDLTGSAGTMYISHGAVDGAISWRVRTQNVLGEWSPWSAISAFTLATPLPVANPSYPLSVYVDPDADQTFLWAATSPISAAITGHEIAWKLASADTWTTATGGAAQSRLIPGGTLPEGAMEWRVRVTDADGRVGAWSETIAFMTQDVAPLAPTPLGPIDVYIPVSDAVRFRWTHNNILGTPQGSAEIQYRSGSDDWTTIAVAGAAQTVLVPAFTLSTGAYGWRARTFNRDGESGPWSAVWYFSVTGAAETPAINQSAANGARPAVAWTAEGQIVYEVQIWQDGAMIDRYMAAAASDSGYYQTRAFAAPGLVVIRVRNQNQFGFWSDWAQTTVVALSASGAAPALSAAQSADGLAIRLDVTAGSDGDVILYRDGVPIALALEPVYLDYGAAAGTAHAYRARTVFSDGTYADSEAVAATLELDYATIAPAGALNEIVPIRVNMDGPPEYARQVDTDCEQIVVAGRALPVTQYGEHRSASYAVSAAMTKAELDALMRLKYAATPVLYRDAYGRRDYCRLASVLDSGKLRQAGRVYLTVSIALDATDYDEAVAIG